MRCPLLLSSPIAQPMEPTARGALDDLGSFQLRDGPEHSHRELVFGVVDVIPAFDDDLLSVLEELAEDDGLVCDVPMRSVSMKYTASNRGARTSLRSASSPGRSSREPLKPSSTYSFTSASPAAAICLLSSSTWLSIVPSFCWASVLTRAYNTVLFIRIH
jgi:hypothetical protein